MSASLKSPLLKLGWAYDHIEALDNEISGFFDGDTYSVVSQFNAETDRHDLSFAVRDDELPFERWSLLAGDTLYALRSALDHTVYQLAILRTGQDPPPSHRQLEFPVFLNELGNQGYSVKAPAKLANVSNPAKALVKKAQPFGRSTDLLWQLHELNNTDKHRELNVTAATMRTFKAWDANTIGVHTAAVEIGFQIPPPQARPPGSHLILMTPYDGMPIGNFTFGPLEINRAADVQTDATFDLVFDNGTDHIAGQLVISTLAEYAQAVESVIGLFAKYF